MSGCVRPRGQQDSSEAACQPCQGRSATRGPLGEQHGSLGSVGTDTNPPGWGSGICSPRGSGRAWEGRGGPVGVGGQAWGARRVRRGRRELGKLRVGAALPAPPAGLAGAPGPPCATPDTPTRPRVQQAHRRPSQHGAGAGGGVPFPAAGQGNGKSGANPWILGLPEPRCAFRAPSPSQGWGAKK